MWALAGYSPTQLRSSAPLNSKVAWFHCFFSVLYPVHGTRKLQLPTTNLQRHSPLAHRARACGQCARKSLQPPAHLAFATTHHRLSPQVSLRLPRISRLRPRPGSGTLSLSPPYLAPRQGALSLTSSPRLWRVRLTHTTGRGSSFLPCSSAPRGLHEDVRDVLDALQHIRRATRTLVHPQRIGQVLDVNVCRLHLDLDRLFRAIAGETRSLQGGV